jgi:hypothetical protein
VSEHQHLSRGSMQASSTTLVQLQQLSLHQAAAHATASTRFGQHTSIQSAGLHTGYSVAATQRASSAPPPHCGFAVLLQLDQPSWLRSAAMMAKHQTTCQGSWPSHCTCTTKATTYNGCQGPKAGPAVPNVNHTSAQLLTAIRRRNKQRQVGYTTE